MITKLILGIFLAAAPLKTTTVKLAGGQVLNVEMATEPGELNAGLMGRKSLSPDSGMLFVNNGIVRSKFYLFMYEWPVDIVWIDQDKTIVNMRENAAPCRNTTPNWRTECPGYDSIWMYTYALHVPAGTIKRLKIRAGDVLSFDVPAPETAKKAGPGKRQ